MQLSEKMNGISSNINFLRFVAAVFVIFSHSFYVAASQEDPFAIFCNRQANFGGVAVAIFFFLSGFYVAKSLYKKNDVKEYFKKRCARIFPQLWIVVLVSVFFVGPIFSTCSIGKYLSDSNTYLYLLNGILLPIHNLPGVFEKNIYDMTVNGPLWTLPIEFFAYCGLAVLLIMSKYVFKNEKMQKILHAISVCVLLVVFVGLDIFVDNEFLITVIRPLILFFIGVLFCDYADKIRLNIPIAIFLLLVLVLSCKVNLLNYAMIICLPYIIVTFMLGTRQIKIKGKILTISYEMYLIGWPIQQIVTHCFAGEMNPYLNFVITMPIDIVLAFALFILIEKIETKRKRT